MNKSRSIQINVDLEKVFFICTFCKGTYNAIHTPPTYVQQIVAKKQIHGITNPDDLEAEIEAAPICPSCVMVLEAPKDRRKP